MAFARDYATFISWKNFLFSGSLDIKKWGVCKIGTWNAKKWKVRKNGT